MNFLLNVLKGIMIGIANVIPGVSGGTMAVSLGIYDRLLGSISGLFKHLRESITFLFQIFLGCAIGIIGFTYAIEYLLSNHTFVTCMAFVGLILGGLPMLWKSMRNELKKSRSTIGVPGVLFFLLGLLVCGGFPLLKAGDEAMTVIAVTPLNMLILFVLGVVASATMVIPGVSGSMMLMIFGYYYGIIGTIKGFLDGVRALDFAVMRDGFLLSLPLRHRCAARHLPDRQADHLPLRAIRRPDLLRHHGPCHRIALCYFLQYGALSHALLPVRLDSPVRRPAHGSRRRHHEPGRGSRELGVLFAEGFSLRLSFYYENSFRLISIFHMSGLLLFSVGLC